MHQQDLDTSTPAGRAMFQIKGVLAEFERTITRERVMVGSVRAKAKGKVLGRRRSEPLSSSVSEIFEETAADSGE